MKETEVTRDLVRELREGLPNSVVFKHTDLMTGGVPDISVTWLRVTSWLEAKICRGGRIIGRGIQAETCKRLEKVGLCLYVVYDERAMTRIVLPSKVTSDGTIQESLFIGMRSLDHKSVVWFIREQHIRLDRDSAQHR